MFHLGEGLRAEKCKRKLCSLTHYALREECEKAAQENAASLSFSLTLEYRSIDNETNKTSKELQQTYDFLTGKAKALGLNSRSWNARQDIERNALSIRNMRNKTEDAQDFLRSYKGLLALESKQSQLEQLYTGWTRYYRSKDQNFIHYGAYCRKLTARSRDKTQIAIEHSGVSLQELLASNVKFCGFCLPHFKRSKSTSESSTITCPNSGSVRFYEYETPIAFALKLALCEECGRATAISKSGSLRKHTYPGKNIESEGEPILVSSNTATVWRVVKEQANYVFYGQVENSYFKEYLSNSFVRNLRADPAKGEAFLNLYLSLLAKKISFPVLLAKFSSFTQITPETLASIAELQDPAKQIELLFLAKTYPEASLETLERIFFAKHSPEFHYLNMGGFSIPAFQTYKRAKLDDDLDFLDFLHNGYKRESYAQFRKKYQGRLFPAVEKEPRSQGFFTYDREGRLTLRQLYITTYRFQQLSRRSQKLKKYLSLLPREELLNALSGEIPGWLLVTDTISLLESSRKVNSQKDNSLNTFEWKSYRSREVAREYGLEIAKKLDSLGKSEEFLNLSYHSKFIVDTVWGAKKSFIIHSFYTLGIEWTLRTLALVRDETDGVTSRGWTRLVNQGGFEDSDVPEPWQILLLNF